MRMSPGRGRMRMSPGEAMFFYQGDRLEPDYGDLETETVLKCREWKHEP